MIFDKQLEFDPTGTVIATSIASTNVIDLQGAGLLPAPGSTVRPGRDLGGGSSSGPRPELCVLVNTTFTAGGGATLTIAVQGAPDDGTGNPGSYATYAQSGTIALANLVAGNLIFNVDLPRMLPLPNTVTNIPRFLRLNYTVASGPFTGGALQAHIVLSREGVMNYAPGVTVAN